MSFSACPQVFSVRDTFSHILSFGGPKDLNMDERVCKSWNKFIHEHQWKTECQSRLNIPTKIDPKSFLNKEHNSYKKGALLASPKVFDERLYRYYLGVGIGSVPQIPNEISLERRDESDPCDLTQTIGQNYTWIYIPDYFEVPINQNFPYRLDKLDDPTDEEAPNLIPMPVGMEVQEGLLKVPNTVANAAILFKHPKNGNSSNLDARCNEKYKRKRIKAGWICMKEGLFAENQSSSEQQKTAIKAGVVIPELLARVLFNFLKKVSSGNKNFYPDAYRGAARTSTGIQGSTDLLACGGTAFALDIRYFFDNPSVGVAVTLPTKRS